jgi:hypothetical protein
MRGNVLCYCKGYKAESGFNNNLDSYVLSNGFKRRFRKNPYTTSLFSCRERSIRNTCNKDYLDVIAPRFGDILPL